MYAFGRDQVMPLSGRPNDFFFQGRTVGLSIIEALDTLYVMGLVDLYWRTGNELYANTAYQYFVGLRDNARTPNGYTIINDITTTPMTQGDLFPAYGFAENFKYLYLIFARTPRFNTRNFYLSTEGKILRGLRPNLNFSA